MKGAVHGGVAIAMGSARVLAAGCGHRGGRGAGRLRHAAGARAQRAAGGAELHREWARSKRSAATGAADWCR